MKFTTTPTGQLAGNPIGAHVTLQYDGRLLLGEVTGIRVAVVEDERLRVLTVKHFNGEPWPVEPFFMAVDVLERDYALELDEQQRADDARKVDRIWRKHLAGEL